MTETGTPTPEKEMNARRTVERAHFHVFGRGDDAASLTFFYAWAAICRDERIQRLKKRKTENEDVCGEASNSGPSRS